MFKLPSKSQDNFNFAAAAGDITRMASLLESNPRINVNYSSDRIESPLILAAQNGHAETVDFLLRSGAEVNLRKRESDFAAIHHAAFRGHLEVVMALISWDSSCLNMVCGSGHNALHIAVENGRKTYEIAQYLINVGIDINARTTQGNSPLILSLMNNDQEWAKRFSELLLENENIDINLPNNKGETALHWAAQKNNNEIVYLLISKGSEINARDNKGKTPRDRTTNKEIKNILDFTNLPGAESITNQSATRLRSTSLSR